MKKFKEWLLKVSHESPALYWAINALLIFMIFLAIVGISALASALGGVRAGEVTAITLTAIAIAAIWWQVKARSK